MGFGDQAEHLGNNKSTPGIAANQDIFHSDRSPLTANVPAHDGHHFAKIPIVGQIFIRLFDEQALHNRDN